MGGSAPLCDVRARKGQACPGLLVGISPGFALFCSWLRCNLETQWKAKRLTARYLLQSDVRRRPGAVRWRGRQPWQLCHPCGVCRLVTRVLEGGEHQCLTWNDRGEKHLRANGIERSEGHLRPLPRRSSALREEMNRGCGDPDRKHSIDLDSRKRQD